MSRGRKPASYNVALNWEDIFWNSLPTYINILNYYFNSIGFDLIEVGDCMEKLSFTIPKGLHSKEIRSSGKYPVISQSKEYTIGFSDENELLIENDLPLIVFGDHSKTIKFVDKPFVIGADGVKLVKPKSEFDERFFYFFLFGVITDTKDYGRHYGLLRKGVMAKVEDLDLQKSVTVFLDALKKPSFLGEQIYFNQEIERKIFELQSNQLKGISISTELTHQLTLVKKLRQQLLQDAVQGKLVKQNPKDEPASELLKRIKAEKEKLIAEKKIKKEKELPPIKPEEIPFEIPENWVWCRLGEIAYITSGSTPSQDAFVDKGIPYLKMYNLRNQKIDFFHKPQYIKEEVHNGQLKRCRAFPGDVLMNIVGPPLGKIAIIPDDLPECNFNQAAVLIRPLFKDMNFFIFWYLNDMSEINSIDTKGVAGQDNISVTQAHNMRVPLPPLSEQKRIVQKVKDLMQYCDNLEASIKQSAAQNEKLLQQVLREALRKK